MDTLVKIEKKSLIADSRVIAEGFNITNKSILNLIRSHEKGLKKFGKVTFQKASTKSGQTQSFVELNEPQTMLLLTYTRSNDATDTFREKLVHEFYEMKEALKNQEVFRMAGIEMNKSLNISVDESGENGRMHGRGYGNYTRLVYQLCGLTEKYSLYKTGYPKGKNFRDTQLSADELNSVKRVESMIKAMIELDKQYSEIKETLKPLFERKELNG